MVQYVLTGSTGYGIKVFRRFEVTIGAGPKTNKITSKFVKELKESIMQEFPGKSFRFSVSLAR